MMLLVRWSTPNRTGTSELSPLAAPDCMPAARNGLTVPVPNRVVVDWVVPCWPSNWVSMLDSERASPLTIVKTLICAWALGSVSNSLINASINPMLFGGAVTTRALLLVSTVTRMSASCPDSIALPPWASTVMNDRIAERSRARSSVWPKVCPPPKVPVRVAPSGVRLPISCQFKASCSTGPMSLAMAFFSRKIFSSLAAAGFSMSS